jgi:DNA primase small subunit
MDASSPDVMLAYYKRLFPFKSLFTWINQDHQPRKLFTNREFAFTLPGDVYLRYQSFNNAEDLKKQVCALNPSRFEIGPQYTLRVRIHSLESYPSLPYPHLSPGIRRHIDLLHFTPSNVN